MAPQFEEKDNNSNYLLLPLKSRWIKQIWSKKPRKSHKPTANRKKNVRQCPTFIITICKVYYQQKHHFQSDNKDKAN